MGTDQRESTLINFIGIEDIQKKVLDFQKVLPNLLHIVCFTQRGCEELHLNKWGLSSNKEALFLWNKSGSLVEEE